MVEQFICDQCAVCGKHDIQYDDKKDVLFCVDCKSTNIILDME